MDDDDFYEAISDPEKACGMIWILAHWLLPAKATREDALALISRACEESSTGLEIADREDWLCGPARCAMTRSWKGA